MHLSNILFSFLISASTSGIDSTTSVVFTNPDTSTLASTESTSMMSEIPSQETTFSTIPLTTMESTTGDNFTTEFSESTSIVSQIL